MRKYNLKRGIVDIAIQGILLFMAIASTLVIIADMTGLIFLMILQFVIGLYQICSGIIGAALGRKWKITYLIVSLIYIILLGVVTAILSEIMKGGDELIPLAIMGGIIVPYAIAIGYFVLSIRDLQKGRMEQEDSDPSIEYMDESILDEGMT